MSKIPIDKIRNLLHLDVDPWMELPNDLLEMAFRPLNVVLEPTVRKNLVAKYG